MTAIFGDGIGLKGRNYHSPGQSEVDKPSVALTAIYLRSSEGYVGFIEELPGINSYGHSIDEARDMLRSLAAVVFDERGNRQGIQTKNQLDPSEDRFYVPGTTRQLFEVNGTRFGVAICHEGWRYPETVRWAAVRGAKIVFHPQHSGNEKDGVRLTQWGAADGPYYEKAMMMRSIENTIYFASVNYAVRFQESATTLIAPDGRLQAYLPYGEEGLLVQDIDPKEATGLLARRFAPERYIPCKMLSWQRESCTMRSPLSNRWPMVVTLVAGLLTVGAGAALAQYSEPTGKFEIIPSVGYPWGGSLNLFSADKAEFRRNDGPCRRSFEDGTRRFRPGPGRRAPRDICGCLCKVPGRFRDYRHRRNRREARDVPDLRGHADAESEEALEEGEKRGRPGSHPWTGRGCGL